MPVFQKPLKYVAVWYVRYFQKKKKEKSEQQFYNEAQSRHEHYFYQGIQNWYEHYWKIKQHFYKGTLNRTQLHFGESTNKHMQIKQKSNQPQNSPQKSLTKVLNQ